MKDKMHDDAMAEMLRDDPGYAIELLNSILEDGNQGGAFDCDAPSGQGIGRCSGCGRASQLEFHSAVSHALA